MTIIAGMDRTEKETADAAEIAFKLLPLLTELYVTGTVDSPSLAADIAKLQSLENTATIRRQARSKYRKE